MKWNICYESKLADTPLTQHNLKVYDRFNVLSNQNLLSLMNDAVFYLQKSLLRCNIKNIQDLLDTQHPKYLSIARCLLNYICKMANSGLCMHYFVAKGLCMHYSWPRGSACIIRGQEALPPANTASLEVRL